MAQHREARVGYRSLAGRRDGGEQPVQVVVPGIAGQAPAFPDKVAPGKDRTGRGGIGFEIQEAVEGAQGSQPPVDGSRRVADLPAVGDVGVYVAKRDDLRALVRPGEKKLYVICIVSVRRRARVAAAQPPDETKAA